MRIILDVDGVICDYTGHWTQIAERVLGGSQELKARLKTDEPLWYLEDRYDLTSRELVKIDREIYTTSPEHMAAIPGAEAGVNLLLRQHDVFFATTSLVPNPLWEYGRRRWFDRKFGTESARRLVFTRYKHILAANVFVDDKEQNVREWLEGADRGTAILFGSPAVPDWIKLLEMIETIARQ